MLKYLEQDCKYVEITGFRGAETGDAKDLLNAIRGQMPEGAEAQFFDADLIATWQHLYFAVVNALMAFRTKRNVSKSLAVEVMLYASAQRQIKKAIALIGVKSSSTNVAAVILGESAESAEVALCAAAKCLRANPDERVLELSAEKAERIKRAFDVGEVELETARTKDNAEKALVDAVVERVALLSTRL